MQRSQNIGYKGIFIDAYKLHRHGILPATLAWNQRGIETELSSVALPLMWNTPKAKQKQK